MGECYVCLFFTRGVVWGGCGIGVVCGVTMHTIQLHHTTFLVVTPAHYINKCNAVWLRCRCARCAWFLDDGWHLSVVHDKFTVYPTPYKFPAS